MKDTLDIRMLNGYSHTLNNGPLRELVVAIDTWIEHNTEEIGLVMISRDFKRDITEACDYFPAYLKTVAGDPVMVCSPQLEIRIQIVKARIKTDS